MNDITELERVKRLPLGARRYDVNHPNYHYYDVKGWALTYDTNKFDVVKRLNRLHPAPGTFSNRVPVRDRQRAYANVGLPGNLDEGPIMHGVIDDGRIVVNLALEGHALYPGWVKRVVVRGENSIYMRTLGGGIGNMATINEAIAYPLWHVYIDGYIRSRLNIAAIGEAWDNLWD
jgi:hypothetical protein